LAKFKCVHTGTVLEFKSLFDIQEMRKHPEYTEVKEDKQEAKKEAPVESKVETVSSDIDEPVKRGRGRPRKVE
jgi:hypothetical protein